jgi:hypothetical protein
MPSIKPITTAGIPAALQKAQRYRVLNDSSAAESICLDVLALDPQHAEALVTYVLAITDQFAQTHGAGLAQAHEAVARLTDPYKNAYYNGIICERWANSIVQRGLPRAGSMAYDWIARALHYYEQAERIRPAGNDEAILRWNTCVRMLDRDSSLKPAEAEAAEPISGE